MSTSYRNKSLGNTLRSIGSWRHIAKKNEPRNTGRNGQTMNSQYF